MPETVLLVGGDSEARRSLGLALERGGAEVHWVAGGRAAVTAFHRLRPDAVLVDARHAGGAGGADGLETVAGLAAVGAPLIVLAAAGDGRVAARAVQLGVEQALLAPVDAAQVVAAAARVAEKTRLARENARLRAADHADAAPDALGASPVMAELAHRIEEVAQRHTGPVLITGEAGTGKGLVARMLHRLSRRGAAPFVEVGWGGAVTEPELFGAETGAPGGPLPPERRHGLVEVAHGGTLFLTEVGALELALQPRLLQVVERGTVRRQGGTRDLAVDVRIVAATARDLAAAVRSGGFRGDLYERLRAATLVLPALRARTPEDRLALITRLQAELATELPGSPAGATSDALERLSTATWPGNIRELRSTLERALLRARGAPLLDAGHLPPELRRGGGGERRHQPHTLAEIERRQIERALRHHAGNRTHAARELGISRATLINKIRTFALDL